MAIADRLNEITTHLENDWTNIEALGGSAEDRNIENIAQALDDVWENLPHTAGTGTNLSLNTKKGKAKVLENGNTSQETTTGKNLLNPVGPSLTLNDVTFTNNGDGTFTANGTASAATSFGLTALINYPINLEANQPYTQSLEILSGTFGGSIVPSVKNSGGTITYNYFSSNSSNPNDTKTPTENLQVHTYNFYISSGYTINNCTFRVQLEKGSSPTSYEKYTGGIASPNPSYPQTIHNVKEDNTIITTGLNQFNDYRTSGYETKGITVSADANGVKLNGTFDKTVATNYWLSQSNNEGYNNLTLLKANTTYTISVRLLSGTMSNTNIACYVSSRELDKTTFTWNYLTPTYSNGTWNSTFTTGVNDIYISGVRFNLTTSNDETFTNAVIGIQVEENNSVSPFEKYQSSTYPLNLPVGIELNKISTYKDGFFKAITGDSIYDSLDSATKETLDYGEWYLKKEIDKYVFGNEVISWTSGGEVGNNYYFYTDQFDGLYKGESFLCDKLLTNVLANQNENVIRYSSSWANIRIYISTSLIENTTTSLNTWLENNKPVICIPLSTPTYTKITDNTLIDQLNAVYRANSYKGQTNISQVNNDLPFNLDVTALEG